MINIVLDLIDKGKILKDEVICINNNKIMGSDKYFNYLTVTSVDTNTVNINYSQSEMNTFLKENQKNILQINDDTLYTPNSKFKLNISNVNRTFDKLYNAYLDLCNSDIKFYIENVRDEQFESAISKKTSEGISLYKIDKEYVLTIFKGLLPVNKKDKVSLKIYDNKYIKDIFIANFIIDKGKGVIINVYLSYMKLS